MSIVAPATVAWQRVINENVGEKKEVETFNELKPAIERAREVIVGAKNADNQDFTGSDPEAHITLHPGDFEYKDALGGGKGLDNIYITMLPGAITQDSTETFPPDSRENIADLNSFASRVFFAEAEDEFIFDSDVTVKGDFSLQGNVLTLNIDNDIQGGFRIEDKNWSSSITYNIADEEWTISGDTQIEGALHSDILQLKNGTSVQNIKTDIQNFTGSPNALVTESAILNAIQGGGTGGGASGDKTFGQAVFDGDGTKTEFQIQHGLGANPVNWQVFPASDDASSFSHATADDSKITVFYDSAPPGGKNNVVFGWKVSDGSSGGFDKEEGQISFDGDGSTTQFQIPHGLSNADTWQVTPNSSDGSFISNVTADLSKLTVNFDSAPPPGSGNVKFTWEVTATASLSDQVSFSGDGSTTQFSIFHGLSKKPASWQIEAVSPDAAYPSHATADGTNIDVFYDSPPPEGMNNVVLNWSYREQGDSTTTEIVNTIQGGTDITVNKTTGNVVASHGNTGGAKDNSNLATFLNQIQLDSRGHVETLNFEEISTTNVGISENGSQVLQSAENIDFAASDDMSVDVQENGNGAATVEIGVASGEIGVDIEDNSTGVVSDASSINFGDGLDVNDDGGGAVSVETIPGVDVEGDGAVVASSVPSINFTASNDANVDVQDDGDGTATVEVDVDTSNFNSDDYVAASGDTMSGQLTIDDSLSVDQDVSVGGNNIGTNSFRDLFVDSGEPSGSEGEDGDIWFETGTLQVVESISAGPGLFNNQQTGDVTISHGPTSSVDNSAEPITSLTFDQFGHVQTLSSGSEWVKDKFIGGNKLTYTKNFDSEFDLGNASYTGASFDVSSEDTTPKGTAFNSDGTRMFVVGGGSGTVYEYELFTEFNISSANYSGSSFDVSSEVGNPNEIKFNNGGTKMFVVGSNSVIYEYDLNTGFDVTTASYSGTSFDVSSEDTDVKGFVFNNDGTKMFSVGNSNDIVCEYDLSAGFDLSTASYSGTSFDVSSEDSTPIGIVFNNDGSEMFVLGKTKNNVYKYDLDTNFNLSTTSYSGTSFDVSSEDSSTTGLVFSTDGSKMFTTGDSSSSIHEYSTSESGDRAQFSVDIFDTDDLDEGSNNLYYTSDRAKNQFEACGDLTYIKSAEIEDILTASYTGTSFDVSSEDGYVTAFAFNGDGTRMFVVGQDNDSVFQYNLSAGFDISTASYSGKSFDVSSEISKAEGIDVNNAGTKMFVCDQSSQASVYEYNLSTDSDLSTASYSGTSFDVSSEGNAPEGITFVSGGTKMFIADAYNNNINEYGLNTAFDISTASFNTDLDVISEAGNPSGVNFNADGTEMYVVARDDDNIYVYDLNNGFDLSTASYSGKKLDTSSEDYGPTDMRFSEDRKKMFILGGGNDAVYEYENTTGKACFSIDVSEIDDLLSSSTTDDLAEGSTNQYFTNERAQDAVATALVGGNDIQFNYDDAANEITADFTGTSGIGIEDDGSEVLSKATALNFGEVLSASDEGNGKAKIGFGGEFGEATFSGDGSSDQFQIPHGLSSTPSYFIVNATSDDGSDIGYVTADTTNINVEYDSPPPSGTDNISLNWFVL